MILRFAPSITQLLLLGPVLAGLAGSLAPAFGWLPVLGGMELSLDHFRALFETAGLAKSVTLSLSMALLTTLLSLAMTIGLLAGWSGTRLFATLQKLISPLLSIPHAATALGFAFLLAPSGWFVRMLSPHITGWSRPPDWLFPHDPHGFAMLIGLASKELPFLLLVTLAALPQSDATRMSQVSRTLGYGRMMGWIYGVWPQVYRQIRLPVFAVIAYASSVVDVALILGPTNPPTLAVQLLRWMSDPDLNMRFLASAGAVLQLVVTLSALAIWWLVERLTSWLFKRWVTSGRRFHADDWLRFASAALVFATVFLLIAGLVGLAVWSFAGFWRFPEALPVAFTLKTWMGQFDQLLRLMGQSILIGLMATIIALILTLACLEQENRAGLKTGRGALTLLYVPLIMPQVSFLFGLQLLALLAGLQASLLALVASHLIFVLPYVFLSLGDPWRSFDPRYAQLGASLGHGPWTIFFRLRLPILLRAVLTASAIGFAVSIGQYLPTILIGAGRWETITTEAVALSAGGNRRIIGVYALIQMALPFIGFLLAMAIPGLLYRNRRALKPAHT